MRKTGASASVKTATRTRANAEAPNVQFRLDPKSHEHLSALAAAYELSPGQFARRIVIEYLEDAERLRIREQLSAIEAGQKRLRDDLATAALALLIFAGGQPEDEARKWIDENLPLIKGEG